MQDDIINMIRDKALSDFPNDYETALYQIENQIQALKDINSYNDKEIPEETLLNIKKKAVSDFNDDFETALYQIKNQAKAWKKINKMFNKQSDFKKNDNIFKIPKN